MLTKAQIKYIRSLTQQKYRNEHKVFVAEGVKIVQEWLQSNETIQMIIATEGWVAENMVLINNHPTAALYVVKESVLDSITTLQTANQVIVVAKIPRYPVFEISNDWYIALDDIQDPGNMGTIIRIADWFGIKAIFCSPGCVDVYNPKVVQAGMGGHLRVKIYDCDLVPFLSSLQIPILAASLAGTNIFEITKPKSGILIIGNESKGITEPVLALATHQIKIPQKGGAESLNAGVATGILCALLTNDC